ncbi:MAG: hypothetical protein JXX14_03085 [Deltaproteobacteria bacterium]|nr:hypothetical protein [Deltaproteobacteria bacterium]
MHRAASLIAFSAVMAFGCIVCNPSFIFAATLSERNPGVAAEPSESDATAETEIVAAGKETGQYFPDNAFFNLTVNAGIGRPLGVYVDV